MGKGKLALIIVCSFFGVVLLYALICSGITFIPMLKMSKANKSSVGVAAEPSETIVLENGVNLYAFPHDGIKDKYVLVCPGGGYTSCELQTEGFPIAAELNKLGYTAFVLEYRTGKKITTPQAPLDDLANAIAYIDENANRFNVYAGYYVLCGFSAGGNLIGLFGTEEYGYSNYEDISAPNALIMGYPWCNPSEPSFNGNLADYIFYASLNGNGAKAFLGSKKSYDGMQVPMWVTENYPRTYIMHGTKDTVAPKKDHSDYLVAALEDNNIEYKYNVCENVYHGCGLGLGTAAEGWLSDAMAFSCEHWYEEDYLADPLTPEELTQKAGGFLCGVCHPQERYDQLEDLGKIGRAHV